jgi:hypothetical protein
VDRGVMGEAALARLGSLGARPQRPDMLLFISQLWAGSAGHFVEGRLPRCRCRLGCHAGLTAAMPRDSGKPVAPIT